MISAVAAAAVAVLRTPSPAPRTFVFGGIGKTPPATVLSSLAGSNVLAALIAAIALCSCSLSPPAVSSNGALPATGVKATASRPTSSLLYALGITKTNDDYVYVLSYPKGALVQVLGPIFGAHGLCVDVSGDVFISAWDGKNGSIVEYAHGGSKPLQTLDDKYGFPLSCAADPRTGDLAVTNYAVGKSSGSVAVFARARGKPRKYADPTIFTYDYAAYDENGDLFIDGHARDGAPSFAELRQGSSAFLKIRLDPRVGRYPTNLQWEDGALAVGVQYGHAIYQVKVAGRKGEITGSTSLGKCTALDFFIQTKKVLALCGSYVVTFRYPEGGKPLKIFRKLQGYAPIALVISP
jgi:hypothetical protein